MMPESVLVPLLDAIWKNEARNETDYDQILTREVKTDTDENHKLDEIISYPNFYVISEDISCGGESDSSMIGLILGALLVLILSPLWVMLLSALLGRAIGFFSIIAFFAETP